MQSQPGLSLSHMHTCCSIFAQLFVEKQQAMRRAKAWEEESSQNKLQVLQLLPVFTLVLLAACNCSRRCKLQTCKHHHYAHANLLRLQRNAYKSETRMDTNTHQHISAHADTDVHLQNLKREQEYRADMRQHMDASQQSISQLQGDELYFICVTCTCDLVWLSGCKRINTNLLGLCVYWCSSECSVCMHALIIKGMHVRLNKLQQSGSARHFGGLRKTETTYMCPSLLWRMIQETVLTMQGRCFCKIYLGWYEKRPKRTLRERGCVCACVLMWCR